MRRGLKQLATAGTQAVPFCTISQGTKKAIAPGDVVHVAPGTRILADVPAPAHLTPSRFGSTTKTVLVLP
jgi:hypothetical protein